MSDTFVKEIDRGIHKTFRKRLWSPFIRAVKDYQLINEGDRIAVCISGGKDSMCMAKLIQLLQRYSEVSFEVVYLVMDPGYSEKNRTKIEENAKLLGIPVTIFETKIFRIAENQDVSPCYVCARMRRGALYNEAKKLGCNKIALGHHLNDVIETTLMAMFYAAKIEGMMPKLRSQNYEGMELIRPMYCVKEEDIIAWKEHYGLEFLQCACRFTESLERDPHTSSKRKEIKELLRELKKTNPEIEHNLFHALHHVEVDTFPGYKKDDVYHDFPDIY